MEIVCCGCNTTHQIGEFCKRMIVPYYFIGCFSTPFKYESEGKLCSGMPGDILITPPGSAIYHGPQSEDEMFVNDWMYVYGDDFSEILEKYPLPYNSAFSIGLQNHLKNCIEKILKELTLKQKGYGELVSCFLTETVVTMHRLQSLRKQSDVAVSRIESAKELVARDLSREWTLREMAELSGYSEAHFSSLYVKRFGLSPKADLIRSRIQLAKQLLYYGKLPVADFAEHYSRYKTREITKSALARQLGVSRPTLNRLIAEHIQKAESV